MRRDIASAWQLRPEMQVGIAALKTPAKHDLLVAVLRKVGSGRVGVSPSYPALDQTASSLRLTRIALAASRPGGVTTFDAPPVAVTVASAAEVMPRVAAAILGLCSTRVQTTGTPSSRPSKRDVTTMARPRPRERSSSAIPTPPATGSAGSRQSPGRSLADPLAIAELCLALEAVRSRPELLSSLPGRIAG